MHDFDQSASTSVLVTIVRMSQQVISVDHSNSHCSTLTLTVTDSKNTFLLSVTIPSLSRRWHLSIDVSYLTFNWLSHKNSKMKRGKKGRVRFLIHKKSCGWPRNLYHRLKKQPLQFHMLMNSSGDIWTRTV